MDRKNIPRFGVKGITANNWNKPDYSIEFPKSAAVWVRRCLGSSLDPSVPVDILELFEGARGVVVYGWYYVPILTIGCDELHRCAEAAVLERCTQVGISTKFMDQSGKKRDLGFAQALDKLMAQNYMSKAAHEHWTIIRHLRNVGAHPKRQRIYSPNEAINAIEIICAAINGLFCNAS